MAADTRSVRIVFAATLAIAAAAAVPFAQAPGFSAVRSLITARLQTESIPSVAVAVVRDGRIIWEEAFGFADQERRILATPRTPYYVASITKTFTGAALTLLAERGRLDLDRPVNSYLGRAKVHSPLWNASEATVRRMANHMAGLTTYDRDCRSGQRDCSMEATIERYAILVHPPGRDFDYSNLDYGILGDVVARISGQRYSDFLRNEIFRPPGMTGCALAGDRALMESAVRYDSRTHAKTPDRVSTTPGASGAFCSVHDLALWSNSVMTSRIEAIRSTAVPAGQGQRYSMGWWIQDDFYGFQSVGGSGGTTYASAAIRIIPSEHVAVAALANTGTNLADQAVEEALAELVPQIGERRRLAAAASMSNSPPRARPAPADVLIGTWSGVIATPKGNRTLTLVVSASGQVDATVGTGERLPFARGAAVRSRVFGRLAGDLRIDEAPAQAYDVDLGLELVGERLVGSATIQARPGKTSPALSYWVDLTKK